MFDRANTYLEISAYLSSPAFEFGLKQKQPDNGVRPFTSLSPSIILEVGDLGSLGQLQTDARLWLRDKPEVSQSMSSFPLIHQNYFRYSWSFCS